MENPNYHLPSIVREKDNMQDFEGPLSLILMLLQKNKIEIRDLVISDITDQYLAYLDRMQSMDLEVASEFVQMASHLLYLKTRELLTTEEEVSELELLMESLEQLQAKDRMRALKKTLPRLKEASDKGLLFFSKLPEPLPEKSRDYEYRHPPSDLLKAMLAVRTRAEAVTPESERRLYSAMPRRIVYSVRDKGRELLSRLVAGPTALESLYADCRSSSELVATFIAILELCSAGNIQMHRVEEQIVLQFGGNSEEAEQLLEQLEGEL